jgi:hypothetical protein
MEDDFSIALKTALDKFDWPSAERICQALVDGLKASTTPYPEAHGKQILNLLRRKRRFALMSMVADAFIRGGQSAPQIVRQYAQSMIDQGNPGTATLALKSIVFDPDAPLTEKVEARGLLGRTYKQMYVDAREPENPLQQNNLRQALAHYYGVYQAAPRDSLWHGINTVALLARAGRDHVPIDSYPDYRQLAAEIRDILATMAPLGYWDQATAMEAAVALGDISSAFDHALRYGLDMDADAFEVASTMRQLTQVWELMPDEEPGNLLLPVLKSALLKREGGGLKVDPSKIKAESSNVESAGKHLEKVFGTDRYQPLGWLKTGLKRCEAIGAVETVMGKRIGTGFLVRASDFFPGRDTKELVFLTNAHVISPNEHPFPGAIPAEAAQMVFEATSQTYDATGIIWSSPPEELDATFITLNETKEGMEICPLTPPPERFDRNKKPRVYVVGYPLGGGLSISLQDSYWLDTDDRLLHYRTPTEPGSSGSPVFDQQFWTLIALHHAGEKDMPMLHGQPGEYEANEGIAIKAIQEATRKWVART